ncbi:hypothetical protein AB0C13_25460 [Streptomyces sp. NPDC049099]|uniref:hypothetical protein n=1 Tax=Streptomyces sp. NPDC049099 TaxID=3155768 RepID=UPI00344956D4
MNRQDKFVVGGAAVVAVGAAAFVAWPPKGWARGDAAGVAQSVAAIIAVAVALLIAAQDRRRSDQAALEAQAAEGKAFARRRLYDQCLRLLQLIENDRRSSSKSPEATALVLVMRRYGWLGLSVDYYVQSEREPNNVFARAHPTEEQFVRMLQEVTDVLAQFEDEDRLG